jgi:hypothetical protein
MNIGMLWFDNDPKTELTAKVGKAAEYYTKKYGKTPNLCLVNPAMLEKSKKVKAGNVQVEASGSILPHHLWIGFNGGN